MYLLLSFVPTLEFVSYSISFLSVKLSVHVHLLLCSAILWKLYKSTVISNNNNISTCETGVSSKEQIEGLE